MSSSISWRSWRGLATLLLLKLLATGGLAVAQDKEPLVTDRPDFTESAESVDRGRVQLESGVTYTEVEEAVLWSFGEVLVRVGVSNHIEVRIGLNSHLDVETPTESVSGMSNSTLGAKFELTQGREGGPLGGAIMALIAQTVLPTGASEFRDIELAPSVVWSSAWDLSSRLSLGTNLGLGLVRFDEVEAAEGTVSVALGIGLFDRWGTYAELFSIFPFSDDEAINVTFFNAGVTYLISTDLQLDFRAGHGINGRNPDFLFGAGISHRW